MEAGMDQRMAARRHDGRLAAEGAHEARRRSRRAPHVTGTSRICGNARQLETLVELALVATADVSGIGQQRGAREARYRRQRTATGTLASPIARRASPEAATTQRAAEFDYPRDAAP